MDLLKADVVTQVFRLLPGFISAWIFYGWTAHPKKDAFDRVVQALIFTIIVEMFDCHSQLRTKNQPFSQRG